MYVMTSSKGKVWRTFREWWSPIGGLSPDDEAKWAGSLQPPLNLKADYPSSSLLFLDKESLTGVCSRIGEMLVATQTGLAEGPTQTCDGREWVALKRAVAARPEDEGPHNPAGITEDFTALWVPRQLFATLSEVIRTGNEKDDLFCVSTRPVTRAFVYLDISDFSKYPPGQEALIINTLVRLTSAREFWKDGSAAESLDNMEAQLCIGDGYIYVFPDPQKATLFACWMAELIEQLVARRKQMGSSALPVAFHFRIGIHCGPVYRFADPGRGGEWNYIGDGINGGNRVLSVIEKKYDDIIFISDAVRSEFMASESPAGIYGQVRNCLESRGRQEDKHKKSWRVFLLNHSKLCEQNVRAVLGTGE